MTLYIIKKYWYEIGMIITLIVALCLHELLYSLLIIILLQNSYFNNKIKRINLSLDKIHSKNFSLKVDTIEIKSKLRKIQK